MPFEPIRLSGVITKETNDAERPYTLGLSGRPSDTWISAFEELDWDIVSGAPVPKVMEDGIAIPETPQGTRQTLFTRIQQAMNRANDLEATRAENAPTLEESYAAWFEGTKRTVVSDG